MATMLDLARIVVPLGFYDPPTAIAVAWAESRGVTNAVRTVTALKPSGEPEAWHGSRDRGVWQFNSYFHPEVSDASAFDAACAAREAHRVSSGGRNWQQWNVFRSGAHAQWVPQAAEAVRQVQLPAPAPGVHPSWWDQFIGKPLRTVRLLDGPLVEVGYLQDVVRVKAGQYVATTGMFDQPTCAGVKNVQRFFGLKPDGIVGPQTWAVIHFLATR